MTSTSASPHEPGHALGLRSSVRWARAITWSLVVGTTGGLIWLAVAKTDQIVVADGKLEPSGQVREIQIPVGGVVRSVNVREGQTVRAGELLLQLDTETNAIKFRSLSRQLELKRQELASKQTQLESFLRQNSAQLSQLRRSLVLQQTLLNRYESLESQGASAEMQTLQQRNRVEELQGQIEQVQQERSRRQAELEQQRQEQLGLVSQLNSQRDEIAELLRYHKVVAPVAGVVFELQPRGAGFVARASEPVLKLVPFDKLEARVEIPSSEIGFVQVGQAVDLNIDSFPANDFGVLQGTVARVGSDTLPPDPNAGKAGYRFPAVVSLATQQLQLKNNKPLQLQVGMSLKAHIRLRKVTYLQLLTNTFRSKADALRRI